jgi:hypothetical protein
VRHTQRVVDGDRLARLEADGVEAEIVGPGTSPAVRARFPRIPGSSPPA